MKHLQMFKSKIEPCGVCRRVMTNSVSYKKWKLGLWQMTQIKESYRLVDNIFLYVKDEGKSWKE